LETIAPGALDAAPSAVHTQGVVEGADFRAVSHCSLVTPEELSVPLHPPITAAHCDPLHR
jgi:hypothetical protein